MSGEQLEPGTLLNDRYRILKVIGKGGMGTVYQAEHVRLDTILAIKEVRAPLPEDADAQAMLEQCQHEARFLVRLHHPNLPQVTDAFLENDRFFVVMEYIEGVTLEAKQRAAGAEGVPVASVIEWGLQIADVLAYLHSQDPPIIFRDLKPSNVMIQSDGRIRLIDFGIARRFQPGAVKDTNLLGSVGYSPPEQFGRHQTDTRSDIFSFGVTLHHLLTGRDPAHSPFKFASCRAVNPAVPESLSRLVDYCLRLDADARPQSVHEVAMELLAIRDSLPDETTVPAPVAVPPPEPAAPSSPSGNPNIILTNPTLRGSGKTQRGSQKVGSQGINGSLNPASGSQRMPGAPSGRTASDSLAPPPGPDSQPLPANPMAKILIAVSILLVAAAAALAVYVVRPNHHGPPPVPSVQRQPFIGMNPPSTHGGSAVDPPVNPPLSPPVRSPNDTGAPPTITQNRSVTFNSIGVKEVVQDPQGRAWLRLAVSGTAQGIKGDQITIAAFFYDSQSNQMVSNMPQSPYASKDGKLSTIATLTLAADSQPFDLNLELPITAFPLPMPDAMQFHCVAFFQEQRIGESQTFVPLSANLLNGGPGAANGGTPPAANGGQIPPPPTTGGPIPNPGSPPGRTFGTSRGNE